MGILFGVLLGICIYIKSLTVPYEKDELKDADNQVTLAIIILSVLIILGGVFRYMLGGRG